MSQSPDLLAILAERRAQAGTSRAAYVAAMPATGTMTYWLAVAAKQLREARGRKQVHIAASMSKDQSSVYRFEDHKSVPREIDLFIAAYADDLDIQPIQIWELALKLWREAGQEATVDQLARQPLVLPDPPQFGKRKDKVRSPNGSSVPPPRSRRAG